MHDSPTTQAIALSRGFLGLAAITWMLIVLGALVRANGAGLACPDWPLCFGQVVPTFDVKVAFEWGHRALAGGVSIGLAVLSWLGWRQPELRPLLRARLGAAWLLLVVQVVFGGLTVLLLLAPWTVTVHLLVGNAFCAVLLWTSRDIACASDGCSAERPARERTGERTGDMTGELERAALAWAALALVSYLLQMVLGGMVSSQYAGLACAYFPTCDGHSVVPALTGPVGLHVLHRLNALVVLGAFGMLAWVARAHPPVARLAHIATRLVLVQIAVGVANVLWQLPVEMTGLHTALAAALFACTALLLREALRARMGSVRRATALGVQ